MITRLVQYLDKMKWTGPEWLPEPIRVFSAKRLTIIAALIVTTYLFLLMKIMISASTYNLGDDLARITIDFTRLERDEDTKLKDRAPPRPKKEPLDEPPPIPQVENLPQPKIEQEMAEVDTQLNDIDMVGIGDAAVDGDALALVRTAPRYPQRALSRGVEGWVLMEFTISAAGFAINPVVLDSDPPKMFDRAALNAVKRWKYRPKKEDGKAVDRPGVQQLISFKLQKEGPG